MSPRKRLLSFLLAAALLLLLGAILSFSPFARSRANSSAARLGASISIRSVRPALSGAVLADVRLAFPLIPAMSLHFDALRVSWAGNLSISGGRIELQGDHRSLADQIARWRASRSPSPEPGHGSSSRSVSLSNVAVRWTGFDGEGTELTASGLESADLVRSQELRLGSLKALAPAGELVATSLYLAWSRGPDVVLRELRARSIDATVRLPAPSVDPAVPSVRSGPVTPATAPLAAAPAAAPLPAWRERLSLNAAKLAARCAPEALLSAEAFAVRLERGKDAISLGPGSFSLALRQRTVLVDLAPGAQPGAAGVMFHAQLPLDQGPVVLDVNGGPIQLSTLGLRDGDLGLTQTDKTSLVVNAHLELKEDGRAVSFDGNVKASGLSIFHEKLADAPVLGLTVAARLKGDALLDGSHLRMEDSEVDVGALQLMLSGVFERDAEGRIRVDSKFGIPLVACQEALDSLPEKLVPVAHGIRLAGTLSLSGRLRFDPLKPRDFLFDYRGSSDCRFLSVPEQVDVQRFRKPFKRVVYGADNKRLEVDSGPGTPGWVTIGGISQHLEAAVMTTEDGRFRIHHGFDHEAIHNSLKENLLKGAFVRGASTISMQLAKNLYLERKKTLSRKLQELILTMYLEQVLTKEQILELYFNVVEFGPMIYGVGPASWHYFHCSPSELSPGQAMFLTSILPQPKLARFAAGGRLHNGWMNYLYKLIKTAQKRGWLTPEDAEVALEEWVVFGGPPVRMASAGASAITGEGEPPAAPDEE